jgi:hypothetical protein
MSKGLKTTFLVHAVVTLIPGLLLFVIPGRFLLLLGWHPIDTVASRLFGAVLLALAWSSFRGWQATQRSQVRILIEMEAAFTVLASVALLRHLLTAYYPFLLWILLAVFLAWAAVWVFFLLRQGEE